MTPTIGDTALYVKRENAKVISGFELHVDGALSSGIVFFSEVDGKLAETF